MHYESSWDVQRFDRGQFVNVLDTVCSWGVRDEYRGDIIAIMFEQLSSGDMELNNGVERLGVMHGQCGRNVQCSDGH